MLSISQHKWKNKTGEFVCQAWESRKLQVQILTSIYTQNALKPSSALGHCLLCWHEIRLFSDARDKKSQSFLPTQKICTLIFPVHVSQTRLQLPGPLKEATNATNSPKSLRAQDHHPIPIHLSLCLSFPLCPIPPFLLSSTAPSRRKPGLPENKPWSVERDKAEGGRYGRGRQRMFLSFLCPSGCCRPHCSPSWGNQAHVTLARPWAHTCCLLGRVWRSRSSAPAAPHTWEL